MPKPTAPQFQAQYQSTLGSATQVFQFDGSASITQPAMSNFPTQALTISFWVKTSQSGANADKAVLFTYDQGANNAKRLYIKNPTNLEVGFGTSGTGATGVAINDGYWHQITITVSAADTTHYRVQLYDDGLLTYQSLSAVSFPAAAGLETGGNLVLGQGDTTAGEIGFIGDLSEFRLWSQVCSGEQIWTLLEQRLTGSEAGLVLYWALSSASTAGTISGGQFGGSTLRFRTVQLTATVSNYQASNAYRIQYCQLTGGRFCRTDTLSAGTYSIPKPNLNQTYSIQLQVTVGGETSDWSAEQQVVTLNLEAAALQPFQYNSANQSLTATWNAVDQAQQYEVTLFKDGTQSGSPSLTTSASYALPTQLADTATWSLLVKAVSAAAYGPAITPTTLSQPNLTFDYSVGDSGAGFLEASWPSVSGATNYYLVVSKQNNMTWSQVFSQWTSAGSVQISSSQVPTQEGDVFQATLRALGPGTIGAWSIQQQVTVVNLPRPALAYAWDANNNALAVNWNDIATGVTYWLQIFQDNDPTPIVNQHGLTTRTYAITTYLSQPHVYTIKVRGEKSGSGGPANQVTVPAQPNPAYQYSAATTKLSAGWTAVPDAYLNVAAQGGNTYQQFLSSPANSYDVPAPAGGFQEGSQYTFQMRALAEGTLAAINSGTVTIHNLAQPVVDFVYNNASQTLNASWDDIRTQQQKDAGVQATYRVQIAINGAPQAPQDQTARTFDMTSYLPMSQATPVTIQVTGMAQGSLGLASQIISPADIQQKLTYDQTNAALNASWQANNPVYLRIYKQGAESNAVTHYAQASESTYQVPPPVGGFQVNDVWICQAKSLPQGTIGPVATAQATILALAAPALTFAYDTATNVLSATWPDILTPAQAGITLTYNAELYQANNPTPIDTAANIPNTPAGRRYTPPDKLDVNDTFTIKIRGTAQGTLGLANTPPTLTAPNVTLARYDAASGNVSITWTAATGAQGYSYYLELLDSTNSSIVYKEMTSNLNSAFSFTAVSGRTYQARVRALAGGTMTAYSSATQSVTIYPRMVAPTVGQPVADASANTVVASWSFDETPYPVNSVSYLAVLSGDASGSQTVTSKTATFANVQVAAGKTYTVTVQAISGGSYGNSGSNSVVVNGPPAVSNVNIATDAAVNMTVTWNNLSGSDYTYNIRLKGPSNFQYDYPNAVNSGPVTLSQANTGVVRGTSYYAEVAALKNGITGPWSASAAVEAGKVPDVPPNNQPNAPSGGDPISLSSGMFSSNNPDLVFGGVFPLQFITYYSTYTPIQSENAAFDGKPMGNRWNHVYNTQLSLNTQNKKAYVRWGNGAVDTFSIPDSITGVYPVDGVYSGTSLSLGADLVYRVTRKDQTRYLFDQNGKLKQIVSPSGNTLSLTYSSNRLDKVTDDQNGHWFQFSYNGDGRVSGVADSAGRRIAYDYYSNGDLKSYTDPLNGVRSYVYWDSGGLENKSLLKTGTYQNNAVYLYQEYEAYNDGGATRYRVTFQQDANAYAADHQASPQHYGLSIAYSQSGTGDQQVLTATVTDNVGNQAIYRSLTVNGNLLDVVTTLPSGNIQRRTYTYDAFNNVLTETVYEGPASQADARVGNTRTYTYDGQLNVLTVSYPAPIGQIAAYTYYDNNLLKTATDYLGNTMSYQYYDDNTLKQVTDYQGGTTTYTYYPGAIKGLVKTKTDELGNVFSYTYNQDTLDTVNDPLGNVTHYGWSNLGLNTSIEYRNAAGEVLQTRALNYNNMGFQTADTVKFPGQSDANAYTTAFTPTPLNQTYTTTDAAGNLTTFTYDGNLNLKTTTYPQASGIQSVTTNGYDRNNNLTSVQVSPTVTERYTYDPLNRRKTYADPNNNTYTYLYAWVFQGYSTPFPYSVVTQYPLLDGDATIYQSTSIYDVLDRLSSQTNRAGQVTTITYGARPDPTTQTNQLVITTMLPEATAGDTSTQYQIVQVFDALGRLVSYKNEAGNTSTISYSIGSGGPNNTHVLVVTETDPIGKQKISTFNAVGQLISVVEGKGTKIATTQYASDALNRLTKVTNVRQSSNLETTYTYTYDSGSNTVQINTSGPGTAGGAVVAFNGLSQLVKETDALGKSATRTYHPRGFVHTYQQANGKTLTYDYDDAGRYCKLTLSDNSQIVQVLDVNGNPLNTAIGGQTNVTRIFDKWNRITSYTNDHQETIGYSYTPEDKLHVLTYPTVAPAVAKTVTYDYDGLQRLHAVTDWNNRATTYNYYPAGMLSSTTYPNQCTTQFQVDAANRFTGLIDSAQGRVVYSAAYTLNMLDQPDSAGFILPLAPGYAAQSNAYHYNNANEIDTLNGNAVSYDDSGNTTGLPGVSTITYNDNNLIATYGTDTYSYNVEGLRDTAVVAGTSTRFVTSPNQYSAPYLDQANGNLAPSKASVYQSPAAGMGLLPTDNDMLNQGQLFASDLSQVLQTVDGAGNLQKRYIYGLGLIAEESAAGDYRTYLFDERGSTMALADGNGAIVSRFAYSPFGTLMAHQGEVALFLYNGRDGVVSDANGLYYMRARYFRPAQLRFLQRDFLFGDIRYPQTLNRYAYVTGDPIFLIDPLGLDSSSGWKIFGGIVGGIVGGAIIGGLTGLVTGGLFGGSAAAGGVGGAVGGGVIGGVIGGLVGGPIGGVIGGIGGAAGGGFVGSSGTTIGARLTTWGAARGWQSFYRFGRFIRGISREYELVELQPM